MSRAHDAVVVGAGPAGLSAASEIAAAGGSCVLVEQGGPHGARDRTSPEEILSGVGGAGLFSDGKHSFYPAATELWRLGDQEALAHAYERTRALLARHGLRAPAVPVREVARGGDVDVAPGTWMRKRYPSLYVSLEERMRMIADLYESSGELPWLSARVVSARREGDVLALDVEQGDTLRTIEARNVVVATGRLSPRFVRPWLEALGVTFAFRRLELGVRIETSASAPLFAQLDDVDAKLSLALGKEDHGTRLLTFCTCRDGEIVIGASAGVRSVSGRADGPKTGRSSIGLLARITDERLAREVEPYVLASSSRPFRVPLSELLASRAPRSEGMRATFGEVGATLVGRALERFVEQFPELRDDDSAVIHGPCIEGVGDYPTSDEHLAIARGVYVAGDACGRFRGIVASMVSGRYVGVRLSGSGR